MSGSSSLSSLDALTAHTIIDRVQVLLSKLKSEKNLSPDGQKALEEAIAVADGLDPYLEQVSTPHPDILNAMLKKTDETDWKKLYQEKTTSIPLIKEMSAGGFEAVVLREFATMIKAKKILEIGVFTSTTTVALALLPFVEKIVAMDIEPYLVDFAKPFYEQAKVQDKIDFRVGDAIKTIDDLEAAGESFDLVFIDADKGGYWNYYDKIMSSKSLLNPNGMIIADNTVYKASTYVNHPAFAEGQKALGEFNKKVREDPRVSVVVLPIRDGISLIRRA